MAVLRLTNYGRRYLQYLGWAGAWPGATSDGDDGLTQNGSGDPSWWWFLANTALDFNAQANGANPDLDNLGKVLAAYPNSVIDPLNKYTDYDLPRKRVSFGSSHDDANDKSAIGFASTPGMQIQVTVAGGLTNLAGCVVCRGSTIDPANTVIGLFPFESVIASVPQGQHVSLENLNLETLI